MKLFIVLSLCVLADVSWAQHTPEALGHLWVAAIKENSVKKVEQLLHPNCSKSLIRPEILKRMVDGELPPKYALEMTELGPRSALEKAYFVIPEKQLHIRYITKSAEEKRKYGLGKGFPIARCNERWCFVVCTKVSR